MNINSLKINKIVSETLDTKTIYFDIPDALRVDYNFVPGQYLTIILEIDGKEVRRPYSISSMPDQASIGVSVKKVPKGKVSTYLNDAAKEGDILQVMTPEGHFKIKPDHLKTRDHVFFAAGSGITPIMSMIQTLLEEEPKSTCYLLYGNKDEDNIIFKEKLDNMVAKHEDQLIVSYILSKPVEKKSSGLGGFFGKKSAEWKGPRGRINAQSCKQFLQEYDPKNQDAQYYLCGPGDFIKNIENYLKSTGKEQKSIHREFFTSAASKGEVASVAEGLVTVTLKGETFEINVPKGKTILDTLVELKKDPPYSCTSGACSTCMAKVTSGEVTMDSCYALEDDEVEAGYILTCQAHPKSGNVMLTYDV